MENWLMNANSNGVSLYAVVCEQLCRHTCGLHPNGRYLNYCWTFTRVLHVAVPELLFGPLQPFEQNSYWLDSNFFFFFNLWLKPDELWDLCSPWMECWPHFLFCIGWFFQNFIQNVCGFTVSNVTHWNIIQSTFRTHFYIKRHCRPIFKEIF